MQMSRFPPSPGKRGKARWRHMGQQRRALSQIPARSPLCPCQVVKKFCLAIRGLNFLDRARRRDLAPLTHSAIFSRNYERRKRRVVVRILRLDAVQVKFPRPRTPIPRPADAPPGPTGRAAL